VAIPRYLNVRTAVFARRVVPNDALRVDPRSPMFDVDVVVGVAGFWHWVCPCGAKGIRWFRTSDDALASGAQHDCRTCCDDETLVRLTGG